MAVAAHAAYLIAPGVDLTVSRDPERLRARAARHPHLDGGPHGRHRAVSYTAPAHAHGGRGHHARWCRPARDTDIAAANGYAATASLPPGLALDVDSGVISGTPSAHNSAAVTATVTVTDRAGNSAEVAIDFPAVGKGTQDLAGFAYSPASCQRTPTRPRS